MRQHKVYYRLMAKEKAEAQKAEAEKAEAQKAEAEKAEAEKAEAQRERERGVYAEEGAWLEMWRREQKLARLMKEEKRARLRREKAVADKAKAVQRDEERKAFIYLYKKHAPKKMAEAREKAEEWQREEKRARLRREEMTEAEKLALEDTYIHVLTHHLHLTIATPGDTPECILYLMDVLGRDEAEHDPLYQLLTRLKDVKFWYNHWGSRAAMPGYKWRLELFDSSSIDDGGVEYVMRLIELFVEDVEGHDSMWLLD